LTQIESCVIITRSTTVRPRTVRPLDFLLSYTIKP